MTIDMTIDMTMRGAGAWFSNPACLSILVDSTRCARNEKGRAPGSIGFPALAPSICATVSSLSRV